MTGPSEVLTGRVVTPGGVLERGVVEVRGERIVAVRAEDGPADDRMVVPGLVDLHCHGAAGASFTTDDPEQIAVAAQHHLAHGTTTLLGSTVTDAPEAMLAAASALADAADAGHVAGIHLEGPFLAHGRCGAQDPRWLREPEPTLTRELLAAGRGHVRVMTLAPELPSAGVVADILREHEVIAAVGHTEASATVTRAHLARGRGLVTHLFNGMPPMHHREAGPVLGALAAAGAGEAVVELIADGVHVTDETALLVLDLLGPDRVALVTDAMAAAGMPDGDYELGPQRVQVTGGVARLGTGGSIAGGTARLADVVARVLGVGVPVASAVASATSTPARMLGLADRGALVPGHRADVVVLDADRSVERVMRAGRDVA